MLVTMTLTPPVRRPGGTGYRVRLANDEPPRYAPLIHVSSSWLADPRSSTAPAFAASSAVSVTVVRIHICPMKPSGLVPFQSAHGPSPGGALFHAASPNDGSHGRPSL